MKFGNGEDRNGCSLALGYWCIQKILNVPHQSGSSAEIRVIDLISINKWKNVDVYADVQYHSYAGYVYMRAVVFIMKPVLH